MAAYGCQDAGSFDREPEEEMNWRRIRYLLFSIPLLILAAQGHATIMLKLNLEEMTERADRIFRGTVVDIEVGTVQAGGGELPTVTYRFRVDELSETRLRARVWGERFDPERHRSHQVMVKAVARHMLEISPEEDGSYRVQVLFDI